MSPGSGAGRPLRILHVASEVAPWSQSGGLGEVMGGLPDAQVAGDPYAHVAVVTPLYRGVAERIARAGLALGEPRHHTVAIDGSSFEAQLRPLVQPGRATLWFVDVPALYDREGLYGPRHGGDHPDNPVRFAVPCRVAVDLGAELCGGEVDVLHGHDWQGALAPVYLRLGPTSPTASVFTVHNLAFRGLLPAPMVDVLGLPWTVFDQRHMEFWGELSLLKGGLCYADVATTVSPTYAREILEPEFGEGLDGFLRWDVERLAGIRNGVDVAAWDPATDPALPARFCADDLAGKATCRAALAAEHGLRIGPDTTIAVVVSRLAAQKGIDLVAELVPELHALDARLIVIGSGDPALEARLHWLADHFGDHVAVHLGYDAAMARRAYGGADVLLMPSRFEPCGVGQLYAMRYGTIPVAHAVGGLRDTVVDPGDDALCDGRGTGILFEDVDVGGQNPTDPKGLLRSHRLAPHPYRSPRFSLRHIP
ncbi:MAG: glycogen synthase [Myxococcales bacterium]|nr:glycogen synthase [Myxococcales bacterium]